MPVGPYNESDEQFNEAREESARELYFNGWHRKEFQKKYKTWQEFMKSADFTNESDRLWAKFR